MAKLPANFDPHDESLEAYVFYDLGIEAALEVRDLFERMGLPMPQYKQFQHFDRNKGAKQAALTRVFVNACNFSITISEKAPEPGPTLIERLPFFRKKAPQGPSPLEIHPFGVREVEHPFVVHDIARQPLAMKTGLFQINPGVDEVGTLSETQIKDFAANLKKDGIIIEDTRPEFFGKIRSLTGEGEQPVFVTKGVGMLGRNFRDKSLTSIQEERFGAARIELECAFATGEAAPVQALMQDYRRRASLPDNDPNKLFHRHWESAGVSTDRINEIKRTAARYDGAVLRVA